MSKSQTGPISPQEENDHQAGAVQYPPSITNQNNQKAGNDGPQSKDDDDDQEQGRRNHNMCIIDVIRNGEERECVSKERVCRICQVGSDHLPAGAGNVNLVQLGCACKGELGISHYHCAKAWFMQKGNRICEICGKQAKNIEGIEDMDYVELEAEVISSINIAMGSTQERSNRCAKSMCNIILAILILAFLLPWIIHPSKLL